MKKILIISSLLGVSFCFAQQKHSKKFQFNVGMEYRIIPYDFNSKKNQEIPTTTDSSSPADRDKLTSGLSVNVSLDWFFLKNTSIGIVQSFHSTPLFFQSTLNDANGTSKKPTYGLLLDTEIQAKHYFTLKNNDKLFANLGYSMMNRNSDYTVTTNNNGHSYTSGRSFQYDAYKIGVGYQYKKMEIGIGTYIVDNSSNIDPFGSTFGMPYLKINYILSKF